MNRAEGRDLRAVCYLMIDGLTFIAITKLRFWWPEQEVVRGYEIEYPR
ncbi:hypothetical protein [Vibrio sp.]